MNNAYQQLEKKMEKITSLNHMLSMGHWDQAAVMPNGGAEARSKALAELTIVVKSEYDEKMNDLILEAEEKKTELSDWQRSNLNEIKRLWNNQTCLSEDLTKNFSLAANNCEFAWRSLRAENNWKEFLPKFKEVVSFAKEEAQIRADKTNKTPYNAMLDLYEPGMDSDFVKTVFDDLKIFITENVDNIIEKQNQKKILDFKGTFEIEKQKALGMDIMKALGFDFNRGRLDVSHHPFCGGVPEDVRITTRYKKDDFMDSLMGVIHETGHAKYEQGLPKDWLSQPVSQARGMAAHESQSLFYEMQISRGLPFAKFLSKYIKKHFGEQKSFEAENLYLRNKRVKKDFIRVEADEVTYPLHVVLRFEIEKDLMEGSITVEDLPEVWDSKMKEYMGLSTLGNDKDGCMQDVHWPSGAFGYFPTYTLGAMLAAQVFSKVKNELPDIDNQIASGNFEPVGKFLEKSIWSKASSMSFNDLVKSATGEALSATAFKNHINTRYMS